MTKPTRAVRGSDYSPTIAVSEEKDKLAGVSKSNVPVAKFNNW